jgi:peptide/nickel transport system substrate-binding protein
VDALLRGEADIVYDVDLQGRERIGADKDAELKELDSGLCIIVMLNARKGPCRDRRVRQALNYALDVDAIIAEIKHGAADPLNGYLTPHHFGYDPETPPYSYDPEKARALLAEAGYPEGLRLVFDIPAAMPDEAPQLAEIMADQLREAGVTLDIVIHEDRAAYSEMVRAKQIRDGCCFDSSPRSTFRVLREKLQSTLEGPWWQGYENIEVNDLILKAQATLDNAERRAVYGRIYSLIRDDAPWIFLYRPTIFWGVRPALRDWSPRSDGLLLFY